MLELHGLSRKFGGLSAVSDLSVEVSKGLITGLIGPNGAGKTTVFNLVTGVLSPSRGSIRFDGDELVGRRPHEIVRRGIGRTFQTPRLFKEMTVWEHVVVAQNCRAGHGWGLMLNSRLRDPLLAGADEILNLLNLWDARERRPTTLPLGHQRRVEIARALASTPRLLLLDEPGAGLNPGETETLLGILETVRKTGVTLLVIEHDMAMVMSLCDRIVVLNHGQKIAEGTPAEVQANPLVLEAYLGTDE